MSIYGPTQGAPFNPMGNMAPYGQTSYPSAYHANQFNTAFNAYQSGPTSSYYTGRPQQLTAWAGGNPLQSRYPLSGHYPSQGSYPPQIGYPLGSSWQRNSLYMNPMASGVYLGQAVANSTGKWWAGALAGAVFGIGGSLLQNNNYNNSPYGYSYPPYSHSFPLGRYL